MDSSPQQNQLENARSAYLRSAAHQPIHWHEWGEEAFDRARRENKPILVDVGAVWCHWCHVMDGESYEDEETARIINEHYVAIKVDRDERPDIDSRLQSAVQAISGQGGWPLTAFLTPDGKPFYGGTYFPPDDRYGRPGFKSVLERLAGLHQTHPAEVIEQSEKLSEAIHSAEDLVKKESAAWPEVMEAILDSIVHSFDVRHGGFGTAPKFPHCAAVDLLLNQHAITGEAWPLTIAETTLTKMAHGGVCDQIGGGFHRYSTDAHWTVPHFEKMSYDNSELLKNYLHGFQAARKELYREVAEGIIGWVETVMSDPLHGGFYASQDADINMHDDGDYFTWTLEEMRAALRPEEFEVLRAYYGVAASGDMHHNPQKNVLEVTAGPGEIARQLAVPEERVHELIVSGKKHLLECRRKRPTPFIDRTLYVSWNAMMISSFLEASRILSLKRCRDFAILTLDRLLDLAYRPEAGMFHSIVGGAAQVAGLIDDQVQMVQTLLDAFEVTLQKRYFDAAEKLMQVTVEKFWDPKHGGFFDVPPAQYGSGILSARRKPFQDSPSPSANSVAALVLLRLFHFTGNSSYRERAETILKLFAEPASRYGIYAATYGLALRLYLQQPRQILIFGAEGEPAAEELLDEALKSYRLGNVVLRLAPHQLGTAALPPALLAVISKMPFKDSSAAFVCSDFSCSAPVTTPAALAEILSAPSIK